MLFRIERMRRDLLPGVWRVEEESFPEPYPRWYLRALLEGSDLFYAALIDGDVVGYAAASQEGDLIHILSMAVLPPFRRKGIGRALLVRILDEGRAMGLKGAILEVDVGNEAAKALYRSLGFTECGVRRGYYGGKRDAMVFRLNF
ncbi:MAG: GNAT family N-acetyltransferase [Candidatus Bathyarchaeia archaeon]